MPTLTEPALVQVEFVAADRSLSGPGASTRAAAPGRLATPVAADAVLATGLAFLLARPALATTAAAVPLLAAGYLAMAAAALAVPAAGGPAPSPAGPAPARSVTAPGDLAAAPASIPAAGQGAGGAPPLGWAAPLWIGLAAVAAAGIVAGPAPHPRVGAAAAGLGLLAAVAEEALFRRLLYLRLARYGTVAAVLGSAVLFALVHLPAYGTAALPVDLGAGLLLSWQRSASGRWTVPAVTHAVANLLAVT
jgi:membrane protease YdiL (CAAX protease family)